MCQGRPEAPAPLCGQCTARPSQQILEFGPGDSASLHTSPVTRGPECGPPPARPYCRGSHRALPGMLMVPWGEDKRTDPSSAGTWLRAPAGQVLQRAGGWGCGGGPKGAATGLLRL